MVTIVTDLFRLGAALVRDICTFCDLNYAISFDRLFDFIVL